MVYSDGFIYAYCHGYPGNNSSGKGKYCAKVFQEKFGIHLHLLNLNGTEEASAETSFKTAFAAIDELYENENKNSDLNHSYKLRLIGTSWGGQVTAAYATKYPNRVDRIVLLCPAIHMLNIIERLARAATPEGIRIGDPNGTFPVFMNNAILEVPCQFLESCRSMPPYPLYSCDAVLIHGSEDDIVLLDEIHKFFEKCPEQKELTEFIVIEDDHNLRKQETLDIIDKSIQDFFCLPSQDSPVALNDSHIFVQSIYPC